MTTTANDIEFCREKAFAANPLLRTSLPFVKSSLSDRLYALHALFASVELSLSSVHDDEVALRKLAWWLEEVDTSARSASQHPVMRELHRSGAADLLPWGRLSDWLISAMNRIDPVAPSSVEEFHALCRTMGEVLVAMELAAVGAPPETAQAFTSMAARRGLVQLVRESSRFEDDRMMWWCPLDLMTRRGLARADLLQPGMDVLQQELSGDLFSRFFMENESNNDILQNISFDKQYIMNLTILDDQICRKLKHMKDTSPIEYSDTLNQAGFKDVLAGWKTARRVNRLK